MWITHFNTSRLKDTRKALRNNPTKAEELMWQYLKWRKLLGLKFRRQHSVGRYILDFYCPEKKIWIEVDGEYHNTTEQKEYDDIRTEYISADGIYICRFSNQDIEHNVLGVLEKVESFILSM